MSINSIILILLASIPFSTHTITLMLDPAGDAKNSGRSIGQDHTKQIFERTATLFIAQHIRNHITTLNKKANVLLCRMPGEFKDPFEKMRFAQQSNPDMFIHIAVYQSSHIKPHIHFYYNTQIGQPVDIANMLKSISQAHTTYISRSKELVETIHTLLDIDTQHIYDLHKPISIPCSPLTGIAAPACIIEIGVQDIQHIEYCIAPLAESIFACTKTFTEKKP